MKRVLSMYLAGAIRDDHIDEDVSWRERVIAALAEVPVCILNPLGGKTFNKTSKEWLMNGIEPSAGVIVPHDFWCVDNSDIVLFNFRALSQRYPNIGTLIEFGRATVRGQLIYTIVDPEYSGHDNKRLFNLHPFIAENSAAIFPTVDTAIDFLQGHLMVLSGMKASFGGVVE